LSSRRSLLDSHDGLLNLSNPHVPSFAPQPHGRLNAKNARAKQSLPTSFVFLRSIFQPKHTEYSYESEKLRLYSDVKSSMVWWNPEWLLGFQMFEWGIFLVSLFKTSNLFCFSA
jgi:hypothetical protein